MTMTPLVREWSVMIYAGHYHTNPHCTFMVEADCKVTAMITGLCLYRNSTQYGPEFDRVEAIQL